MTDVSFVAASNDAAILARNLQASPVIREGRAPLLVGTGAASAARAYNDALDATDSPIVVFLHQDVYLPEGWTRLLRQRIAEVAALDPDWAVIGAFGIGLDGGGIGPVWSSSIGQICGRVAQAPQRVQSVDELLIVLRRDSGLRFDEALPGFHLYGTDIVQQALAAGRGAWAASLPLIHNDGFHEELGQDFVAAYRYMQRKWRARLPVSTSVVRLSWHGMDLRRWRRAMARGRAHRLQIARPSDRPGEDYARLCGWNRVAAG